MNPQEEQPPVASAMPTSLSTPSATLFKSSDTLTRGGTPRSNATSREPRTQPPRYPPHNASTREVKVALQRGNVYFYAFGLDCPFMTQFRFQHETSGILMGNTVRLCRRTPARLLSTLRPPSLSPPEWGIVINPKIPTNSTPEEHNIPRGSRFHEVGQSEKRPHSEV